MRNYDGIFRVVIQFLTQLPHDFRLVGIVGQVDPLAWILDDIGQENIFVLRRRTLTINPHILIQPVPGGADATAPGPSPVAEPGPASPIRSHPAVGFPESDG